VVSMLYLAITLYGFLCCHIFDNSYLHLIHHYFHTIFLVFLLESLCRELVFICLLNLGYPAAMYALYVHNFCFAESIKFKNDNTSKLGICLHRIGGDNGVVSMLHLAATLYSFLCCYDCCYNSDLHLNSPLFSHYFSSFFS